MVRWPASVAGYGSPESSPMIILDNALSGDVSVEESTWTVSEGTLLIDLIKKPCYGSGGIDAHGEPRCSWWPCALRGGKKGPSDPKLFPKPQPNIQRLDCKIGEQAESKKSFQGQSKFQW